MFKLSARNLPGKEGRGCQLEWERGWGPHLGHRGDMDPPWEQLQEYPQAPALGFLGGQKLTVWSSATGMSLENTWSDIALETPTMSWDPPMPGWDPHIGIRSPH